MLFGEFIRESRRAKGIGLRDFCALTGIDKGNWSKIERGALAPPRDEGRLRKIAQILDIQAETVIESAISSRDERKLKRLGNATASPSGEADVNGGALVHFNKAKHEIALATKLDEVKDIRDKAQALQIYAKQAGYSLEMQNQCAEIKIRAERKAGELLKDQDKHKGGRPKENQLHDETSFEEPTKLSDLGISKIQSHRWQAIASIPEEKFEKYIQTKKENKAEITSTALLNIARPRSQKTKIVPVPKASEAVDIDPLRLIEYCGSKGEDYWKRHQYELWRFIADELYVLASIIEEYAVSPVGVDQESLFSWGGIHNTISEVSCDLEKLLDTKLRGLGKEMEGHSASGRGGCAVVLRLIKHEAHPPKSESNETNPPELKGGRPLMSQSFRNAVDELKREIIRAKKSGWKETGRQVALDYVTGLINIIKF